MLITLVLLLGLAGGRKEPRPTGVRRGISQMIMGICPI